jgi:hypothetical protein
VDEGVILIVKQLHEELTAGNKDMTIYPIAKQRIHKQGSSEPPGQH